MKTATPILWDSPINSESIFESKKTISNLQAWKDGLLFLITEPSEGNINVLMYSDTNSVTKEFLLKDLTFEVKSMNTAEDHSLQMVTISFTATSMIKRSTHSHSFQHPILFLHQSQ